MKLTSYLELQVTKNDKEFVFSLPFGAPFNDCYEVAQEMVLQIQEMAKQAEAKSKSESEQESATDLPVQE